MRKIVLVGNYKKDKQESMERFTQMLYTGFKEHGVEASIWRPNVILGVFFSSTTSGLGKWFGYIDKWVLFPIILKSRIIFRFKKSEDVSFHICDHSNSPYLSSLPVEKTVVTCHDVLAIRGALGFADAYCPASSFGKILQKWILRNLTKAKTLAAVSKFTLDQLIDLSSKSDRSNKRWQVIYNSFNANFYHMNKDSAIKILKKNGIDGNTPFLLHVGSSLPRKNRKLLIDMVAKLGDKWEGNIFYAGKEIEEELWQYANEKGVKGKVFSIGRTSHETLVALYSLCEAFVFPSFSEGFGWPVIEAQACGAMVIASDLAPMPEVSGGAALHANPNNPEDFAKALLSLNDKQSKNELIKQGYENIKRFSTDLIIKDYLELHRGQKL